MPKMKIFHESRSLEAMLKEIGEKNNVQKFYFPIYKQKESTGDYPEHSQKFNIIREIPLKKLKEKKLSKMFSYPKQVIGLSSKIDLFGGQKANLAQLDIDYCAEDLEEFIGDMKELFFHMYGGGPGEGFLVKSGKDGFHYHGSKILIGNDWYRWIETAKLSKEVDDNWCEQQLKRGFSVLRLTSSKLKPEKLLLLYKVKISQD